MPWHNVHWNSFPSAAFAFVLITHNCYFVFNYGCDCAVYWHAKQNIGHPGYYSSPICNIELKPREAEEATDYPFVAVPYDLDLPIESVIRMDHKSAVFQEWLEYQNENTIAINRGQLYFKHIQPFSGTVPCIKRAWFFAWLLVENIPHNYGSSRYLVRRNLHSVISVVVGRSIEI